MAQREDMANEGSFRNVANLPDTRIGENGSPEPVTAKMPISRAAGGASNRQRSPYQSTRRLLAKSRRRKAITAARRKSNWQRCLRVGFVAHSGTFSPRPLRVT